MTARTDLTRIDLRAAKLCMELDCNTIFDTALYRHCPTCGSVESYPLESWLNRDPLPKTSSAALDALGTEAGPRRRATPRALWLSRLRERRAASEACIAPSPAALRLRVSRRQVG
jgi:hypothetical protein